MSQMFKILLNNEYINKRFIKFNYIGPQLTHIN